MIVDLHTHTYPASDCSQITYRDYIGFCETHPVRAIALTNHGSVDDNRQLEGPLAEQGVVLVHGVEISTLYGDFIVYSPDLEYLATFQDVQAVPRAGELPPTAALVWVHPAGGGGRSGSSYYPGLAELVAPVIDAVEVWNGNWADGRCVRAAEQIADQLRLPAVGGSDAHSVERLMACATEIPHDVHSTADVVEAIKRGAVRPVPPAPGTGRRKRFFGI